MIQRIQSVFLVLAALGAFGLVALPLAKTATPVTTSGIFSDGRFTLSDNPALLVFFGLSGILALASLFLYTRRALQMRLTIFSIIATVVGCVFGVIFFMQASQETGESIIQDGAGAYLPPVILILLFLAYRFIGKDEKLVKSMDRLR